MRFTHLRVIVPDVVAVTAFYRDVLKLPQTLDAGDGVYSEFDTGSGILAVYDRNLMADVIGAQFDLATAGDVLVVSIRVDDVDAECARLKRAKVELVTEPHDRPVWFQRVAHLRDPAGNLVELYQSLEGTSEGD